MRLLLLSTIVISFSVTALAQAQAQPTSKEDIQKRAQELLKQIEDVTVLLLKKLQIVIICILVVNFLIVVNLIIIF